MKIVKVLHVCWGRKSHAEINQVKSKSPAPNLQADRTVVQMSSGFLCFHAYARTRSQKEKEKSVCEGGREIDWNGEETTGKRK